MAIPGKTFGPSLDGSSAYLDTSESQWLDATSGEAVLRVPGGDFVLEAEYSRLGPDLFLSGEDHSIFLKGYFTHEQAPDLYTTDGSAVVRGSIAARLAGPATPGQFAQADIVPGMEPIGIVDNVEGRTFLSRLDGTNVLAEEGTPVFLGDIVETEGGSTVGITFIDESTFALGESGRMIIDELVFDAELGTGQSVFNVLKGVFSFVSGDIAEAGDDAMVVTTPVLSIGVRGTYVAGRAAAEGSENTVTLLPDASGTVGAITVSNDAGVQVMSQSFATTTVTSQFQAPAAPVQLPAALVQDLYGDISTVLPPSPGIRQEDSTSGSDDTSAGRPVTQEREGPAEEGETAEGEEDGEGERSPEGEEFLEGAGEGLEEGEGAELEEPLEGGGPGDPGEGAVREGPSPGELEAVAKQAYEQALEEGLSPEEAGLRAREAFGDELGPRVPGPELGPGGLDSLGSPAREAFEQALSEGLSREEANLRGRDAVEEVFGDELGPRGPGPESGLDRPSVLNDYGRSSLSDFGRSPDFVLGGPDGPRNLRKGDPGDFGLDGPGDYGPGSKGGPEDFGKGGPRDYGLGSKGGPKDFGKEPGREKYVESQVDYGALNQQQQANKTSVTSSTSDVLPSLSINDVTTSDESAANATFTATLSAASGREVTVDFASSNGTGTAGADYTASSGTLTFAAGETTKTFTVPVLADSVDEVNETATLTLSNASNATISDSIGTLTITDDDATPSLSINDVTTSDESAANATFTATLSGASSRDVTVNYATSNDTLSFTAANIATSADGARGVHIADMDGDGDLDIVSASDSDDTIAWYENDGAADPTWTASNIATSADGAVDVHVADMDGDGDLDIVSASQNDDTIAWYENDGAANPTWTAIDIATNVDGAQGVHVADLDGDGDLDIVSASFTDDTIALFTNNGAADPTWTGAAIDTNADGARAVYVGDVDGDGDLDIVSAGSEDDTIAWYENNGAANPSFTAEDIATDALGAEDVRLADMDGDGDLDIVSASATDDTIAWYENDGAADPSFTAEDIATSADAATDVHIADFDGDGDLDIVSASANDDTIAWYENDGAANPTWTAIDIATSADAAKALYVGDMDGDGDIDIVSASFADDTIAWYESNASQVNLRTDAAAGVDYTASSGTLTISAGSTTATFTVPVLADSFPENNEVATLTLSSASNATISDATGTLTITDDDTIGFTAADIATSADGAADVHIADMDGDGDLDIVSAGADDDTVAWYENDGAADPTFTAADIFTSADGATGLEIADMDGDGDLDILSASGADDKIIWYENNGATNPTWSAATIATSADNVQDVTAADMDGDGDLDIVSASQNDDTIAWYENDGAADPSWSAENIATSADSAQDVHVADLDGDGDLDIVSASFADDTIAWYENNGAANPTWTASNIATSADGAYDVHIADMDGDGDLDIISASSGDDTIAWYENDGAADPTFTAANIATSADFAHDVYVADVDGDGDLDIVSASFNDDTIAWYENDGAANPTWTASNIATNADGAYDVHVGDLDGDGDLDIVSASFNDDTIAWYENNCDGSDPLVLDLHGNGIELLGVAAGVSFDIDADGVLETTGWFGPGDGVLVMDLDDSGYIEDMSEVFSEFFNGQQYAGSLAALASLDDNEDLRINTFDTAFENILVWQDANSDGVSAATELSRLSDQGIHSISLNAEAAGHFIEGNRVEAMGSFEFQDGSIGDFAEVTFAGPRFTLAGVIDTEQQQDDTEIFDYVASPGSGVITGTQPASLLSSSESVIEQFVDSPDQTSASITVDNSLLPADSPHPSEVNEDHMVLAEAQISAASVI